MNNKLLPNSPIEDLTEETDFLGSIEKATLIRDFLIGSKDNAKNIKMYSLYGNWGSGKSSLMKFLCKELSTDYNTFFFEAWEFEKDENLAYSLLEFLTLETKETDEEFFDNVLKYGGRILRGLGKSIKLNIPLFTNGPALELNPSAFVEEVSKNEELSFYEALKNFKLEFKRLESHITREGKPNYNIIFLDDLDRCEPQQVLNLISAIKLFFTFGEKTIFFCGIDKKAVEAAVETKYGKIVKSSEYLEKIFDISFSMPTNYNLQKLINQYFDETQYSYETTNMGINKWVDGFFTALEFNNPRKIKKVLNKYQILRDFISMEINQDKIFPNIDLKSETEKGFFETILVLYLIILHEFHPEDFDGFLNFEKKKDLYYKANKDNSSAQVHFRDVIKTNLSQEPFINIAGRNFGNTNVKSITERSFNICLSPLNLERINASALQPRSYSDITVKEKYIDYLFYKYISSFDLEPLMKNNKSQVSLLSTKNLIKNIL